MGLGSACPSLSTANPGATVLFDCPAEPQSGRKKQGTQDYAGCVAFVSCPALALRPWPPWLQPNLGDTTQEGLAGRLKSLADQDIFTTIIGGVGG